MSATTKASPEMDELIDIEPAQWLAAIQSWAKQFVGARLSTPIAAAAAILAMLGVIALGITELVLVGNCANWLVRQNLTLANHPILAVVQAVIMVAALPLILVIALRGGRIRERQ